jgi:hypothetical protein
VDGGEARRRVRGLDQCPGRNLEVKALQRHFAERVECARARLWVRPGDFGRKCEDLSFFLLGSSRLLQLNQQDLALSYCSRLRLLYGGIYNAGGSEPVVIC